MAVTCSTSPRLKTKFEVNISDVRDEYSYALFGSGTRLPVQLGGTNQSYGLDARALSLTWRSTVKPNCQFWKFVGNTTQK
jgi:hypothetical protein